MIYLRIGASLSRSSRYRNVINGASEGRAFIRNEESLGAPSLDSWNDYLNQFEGKVELLRGYLAAAGAHKGSPNMASLSDFKYIAGNPAFKRFFSSKMPKKKNYENFYPKEKKEIPKKGEQKSESKEEGKSKSEDEGSPIMKFTIDLRATLLVISLIGMLFSSYVLFSQNDEKQISFQEFKNKLLEPGLVDHIVILHKSVAKVYVRSLPQTQSSEDSAEGSDFEPPVSEDPRGKASQYKYYYYFNIGSVETFEKKLEEAQEAMGRDPHDYVPVTYVFKLSWILVVELSLIALLLLGLSLYIVKLIQGGGAGKGGWGIFNIGKAHFTKMDKNAKN